MRERKTVGYTVRLTPTEAEAVRRAAEAVGMSVSDWLRVLGVEGAVRRLHRPARARAQGALRGVSLRRAAVGVPSSR